MNKYSYKGFERIKITVSQSFGLLGLLFFTTFTIFSIIVGWSSAPNNKTLLQDDPRITLLCFMTVFLVITGTLCSTLINQLPTIWTSEVGLLISAYLFFRIRIPWSSIIDIGTGKPPRGYLLVRTRRITPFHRIYGWLYSRTFYPSFLIGSITDRDNLIGEIKRRIQKPL
jgi:hypothetical protein